MLQVCPADVVNAPAERVWQLVTMPTELARWTDTLLIDAPDRQLRAGDRIVFGAGVAQHLKVVLTIRDVVPTRELSLQVRLPFGVTNDEVIRITPLAANACRVAFN